jgi:acetoin utilization protein AcuB
MTAADPTVLSVMTPFPYAIEANATLDDARAMMNQHGIHHLPVLRDGALAGVLSDRDLALFTDVLAKERSGLAMLVWTVCAREPYVADIHTPLAEVAERMADLRIGSALITKNGKLAGILTVTDVCRGFASLLRELGRVADDDDVA